MQKSFVSSTSMLSKTLSSFLLPGLGFGLSLGCSGFCGGKLFFGSGDFSAEILPKKKTPTRRRKPPRIPTTINVFF